MEVNVSSSSAEDSQSGILARRVKPSCAPQPSLAIVVEDLTRKSTFPGDATVGYKGVLSSLPSSTGLCQNYIVVGSWWAFQTMASGCGFSACCCSHGTIWTEDSSKTRSILSSPCRLSMSCLSYALLLQIFTSPVNHIPSSQYSPNRSIKIHSRSQTLPLKLPLLGRPLILVQLALLERFLSGFVHPKVWV